MSHDLRELLLLNVDTVVLLTCLQVLTHIQFKLLLATLLLQNDVGLFIESLYFLFQQGKNLSLIEALGNKLYVLPP